MSQIQKPRWCWSPLAALSLALVSLLGAAASPSAHADLPGIGLGARVYNVPREAYATIIAAEFNGTFVLRFETGALAGQTGSGWSINDLASLAGCSGDLCVGQNGYNVPRESFVRVAGIQNNGRFLLQFTSGTISGQTGSGWSRDDIAIDRGCSPSRAFCVGSQAYNVTRNSMVTVVAIQTSGRMVLRFEGGALAGQLGSGWSEADLAITAQPQPPVVVLPPRPPVVRPPVVIIPGQPPVIGRPLPGPRTAVCTTQSRGHIFRVVAPSLPEARMRVIDVCRRSPFGDAVACAQQSACSLQ